MLKKNGAGEVLGLCYDAEKKKLTFSIMDWKKHAYKGKAKRWADVRCSPCPSLSSRPFRCRTNPSRR